MNEQQAAIAKGMLTPKEAGARCGLSDRVMKFYARSKAIPAYQFGYRTIRFKPSDVDSFREKRRM